MANPEHLKMLKEGVVAWNKWRKENPETIPDLRWAQISEASLSGADLTKVNFTGANLARSHIIRGDLAGVNLTEANLTRVNLTGANLAESCLTRGTLTEANLTDVNLCWANLIRANLSRANLADANLMSADFNGARLLNTIFFNSSIEGTNFANSVMGGTAFANVDLSQAKGIDAVWHYGPSALGLDTIYRSQGKIPEIFLRGAGVPENFITYMPSLAAEPFDYYSCFISHSSKDQDFAKLLHARLQQEGVRCWFAPEDLKTGDRFRQRIDEAILVYDKLLVVLSESSIQSTWVEEEVEAALEKEKRQNKLVLFPIRLDDAIEKTYQAWAAKLRRSRQIADFTKWKEHDHYQNAFKRLLRDLQGEAARGTSAAL